MGAELMAVCDGCGLTFETESLATGSDGTRIVYEDCVTNCPKCGGDARILDGTYGFVNEVVAFLSGPGATVDLLRAAGVIARDSVAAGESAAKTFERAAEILPSLRKLQTTLGAAAVPAVIWTLSYIATKAVDYVVDPLLESKSEVQVEALVKDAVQKALDAREAAAREAGIQHSPAEPVPALKLAPKLEPRGPHFPKTMEKLQSEMAKRYGHQAAQWIDHPKNGGRSK